MKAPREKRAGMKRKLLEVFFFQLFLCILERLGCLFHLFLEVAALQLFLNFLHLLFQLAAVDLTLHVSHLLLQCIAL